MGHREKIDTSGHWTLIAGEIYMNPRQAIYTVSMLKHNCIDSCKILNKLIIINDKEYYLTSLLYA